ncbi:MAG: HD domain-containing protein [Peptococcaceae bacterium]|nr:HD domain-containing protein [Peptococcaceae bacterium]
MPEKADVFARLIELERQNAELSAVNQMLLKRVTELNFLHEMLTGLIKSYDLEATIEAILDMAMQITNSEAGFVMLGSSGCRSFRIITARGDFEPSLVEYLQGNGELLRAGNPARVLVLAHGNAAFKPLEERDPSLRSMMAVSLQVDGRVIGVLVLMHRHQGRDTHGIDYGQSHCAAVLAFAGQAALILDHTRLKIEYGRREAYLKTIAALTSAIDAKDTYTRHHSRNVASYAVALGEELGLSSEELAHIHYGASLHDIGKIGIPEAILNKPDRLTPGEFQIIKDHPAIGANILAPIDFLGEALKVVRHHHERYDGSGYPDGLKGESIPFAARVVGIADAWDAMTSQRAYRRALTVDEALRELQEGAGGQFDPAMVQVFARVFKNKPVLTGCD